jgi:hypothetical protein
MALRLHLPWGLLFTVLGYAGLAAGAAWLLSVDYDGHLHLQVILQALGGAILGALGWASSERVAYAANLNTKPLLRLTVGGMLASYAAAWVTSPYTELTAGSQSLVSPVIAVLLFVAAGILPLVAAIALLSFLETLFAAQRGGGDLRSALRPVLSHAVLGIVLGTISAAVAWFMRDEIVSTVVAIARDAPRTSGWIDRRSALFSEVLRGGGCQVLVVPMEPVAMPAGEVPRSLDRSARSLITREIAAQIQEQTGLCVEDPTLVARALGEGTRETRGRQAWKLGEAAGASWLVRGSVELDPEQQVYAISVALYSRASGKGSWTQAQTAQWGPIAFSDELPPEIAFAAVAADAVAQLGLPAGGTGRQSDPPTTPRPFPQSPAELASDPGSPLERARRLQLLAAAAGRSEFAGEHLWERSWMALRDAGAGDEGVRAARARAALHLHRRPYAMQLLRGLHSTEARALFALAQGNLAQAEPLAAQIQEPGTRLITELELEEGRLRYGRSASARERGDALLKQYPAYAPLLHVTLSGADRLDPIPHQLVQQQLGSLGVPTEDDPLSAPLRVIGTHLKLDMLVPGDAVRRAVAVERSYAPLWRARASGWRIQRAFDRLAEWDYYDALYTANRLGVANPALAVASQRSQAEDLAEAAREMGATFAGYPPLAAGLVWVLRYRQLALEQPDLLVNERERRLRRDVIAWEGGESETLRTVQAAAPRVTIAYLDEPPRAWRPADDVAGNDPTHIEQDIARRLRALAYTQYGFRYLLESYHALRRAGQGNAAQQLVALAQERFIGSPERESFLLALAEESGDAASYVAILEQGIAGQPEDWNAYYRLARAQLIARHPEQAQRTLLAYPLFRSEKAAPPVLATQSNAGAELLLTAGEAYLARGLYQLSAQYQTDAAAHLKSGLRLAQLDGHWQQVRDAGRQLYEQNKDAWGITHASSASFLLGENDEGFRTFFEASKQIEDMRPWAAALAGHRIVATSEDELIGFARRWKALSGNAIAENALRDHFLFNALLIDRAVTEKTVQSLVVMTEKNGDALYKAWISGYFAFKRSNFPGAAAALAPLSAPDAPKFESTRAIREPALPYTVASLAKSGRIDDARALLDASQQKLGRDFHVLLATAYLQGLSGDHGRALLSLWQAYLAWPLLTTEVTIAPPFQILETCEKLHEWTGDERYRVLMLDLARRERDVWPWPWGYSFEAKHAKDGAEREHALAIANFLDPQSEHLAGFGKPQREAAAAWFARNNPFKK